MSEKRFLKNTKTGALFLHSAKLAAKAAFVEVDCEGKRMVEGLESAIDNADDATKKVIADLEESLLDAKTDCSEALEENVRLSLEFSALTGELDEAKAEIDSLKLDALAQYNADEDGAVVIIPPVETWPCKKDNVNSLKAYLNKLGGTLPDGAKTVVEITKAIEAQLRINLKDS